MHHPKVAHPQLSHASRDFLHMEKMQIMEKTGQKTLMFMLKISKNVIKTNSFNISTIHSHRCQSDDKISDFFPKESLKNAGRPACDPAD